MKLKIKLQDKGFNDFEIDSIISTIRECEKEKLVESYLEQLYKDEDK